MSTYRYDFPRRRKKRIDDSLIVILVLICQIMNFSPILSQIMMSYLNLWNFRSNESNWDQYDGYEKNQMIIWFEQIRLFECINEGLFLFIFSVTYDEHMKII